MYRFKQKQTILITILVAFVAICVSYYVYAKEENKQIPIELENTLDEQAKSQEQTQKEEGKILVHVSGAVNQEGVVELEPNSRVADAIEKARRYKRRGWYDRY